MYFINVLDVLLLSLRQKGTYTFTRLVLYKLSTWQTPVVRDGNPLLNFSLCHFFLTDEFDCPIQISNKELFDWLTVATVARYYDAIALPIIGIFGDTCILYLPFVSLISWSSLKTNSAFTQFARPMDAGKFSWICLFLNNFLLIVQDDLGICDLRAEWGTCCIRWVICMLSNVTVCTHCTQLSVHHVEYLPSVGNDSFRVA